MQSGSAMPRIRVLACLLGFVAAAALHAHHEAPSTAQWIAEQEGVRLHPYFDVGGVLTVCVGHTSSVEQRAYTHAECMDLLDEDLELFAAAVDAALDVDPVEAQRTALLSLAFNIGSGAFSRSELVRLINGSAPGWKIALEWLSWDHAHVQGRKVVVEGLL